MKTSADLARDAEERLDTSNSQVQRPLVMSKNKKVVVLIKDELGGKIMKKIVALRSNMYTYLTNEDHVDKKQRV